MVDDYEGPERRRIDHVVSAEWLHAHLQHIQSRFDDGTKRFDTIERRMDSQDRDTRELHDALMRNSQATEETLNEVRRLHLETSTVRYLSENLQAAGRFFNRGASVFHRVIKWIIPVVTLALLLWGAWYAISTGGKPPNIG